MIIVLPQVIGLVLIGYILGNPNAWPVVLLSLFPPCTPIVMCLRMAAMAVPAWQLALSLVLMVLAIYVFAKRLTGSSIPTRINRCWKQAHSRPGRDRAK